MLYLDIAIITGEIAGFVFSTWKMRLEAMLKCVKARIDQMIGGKK